ncbi:MAG TPA: hypothetical protein VFJ53_00465, partial [Solirubrobacterales bacterium]|nr:hypothetical protein [Solirubrobacterales bacterium]
GTVSAWTNTGAGYAQLLSATDSTYEGGKVGLEGSGNITRLTQFKAGLLNTPKAITEGADSLTAKTARLSASVDPEGSPATYQFEYGPTTAYGSKAPAVPMAVGYEAGKVAVNRPIDELAEGTTYHYRVVATNEAGTAYGADKTLTTLKSPKATPEAATAVKGTSATLTGTVNPEGTATSYQFEWGPGSSYGERAPAEPVTVGSGTTAIAVSQPLTELAQNTTYHYRIVATSAAGTTYSADATLTTLKPPTVSTEPATNVKATQATLSTKITPEGPPTSYQFEWGTSTEYGSKAPAQPSLVGSGSGTWSLGQNVSLAQNTTYHYRAVAISDGGVSYGADRTFTTLKLPKATTLAVSNVRATGATLNGSVTPEGSATTYQYEYGPTTAYGSKAPSTPVSVGSGSVATPATLFTASFAPGTVYHYRLVATSAGGTVYGGDQTFQTKPYAAGATQLAALPLVEVFDGSSTSNANFAANWTALGWAGAGSQKGVNSTSGWYPTAAYPTASGAFSNSPVSDSGWGAGAAMTLNMSLSSRPFSLWSDMPNPSATARAGYELRFTSVSPNVWNVAIYKWVGGVQTELGSKSNVSFANGSSLAIVDFGNSVSAWTNTGSGYTQLLSASDATYDSGKVGLEGTEFSAFLTQFKAGPLRALPSAITEAATGVTNATATLKGTVNPQGAATTYQFEYGTTTTYGKTAPLTATSAGSGTAAVAASGSASGLSPNTTYHYRIVASSETGTAYGVDKTMTTLP